MSEQPAKNASVDAWIDYANEQRPADAERHAEMTRGELIDEYGTDEAESADESAEESAAGPEVHPIGGPSQEDLNPAYSTQAADESEGAPVALPAGNLVGGPSQDALNPAYAAPQEDTDD